MKIKAICKFLFFGIAALFLMAGCGGGNSGKNDQLSRQVGQMLMIGFRGLSVDQDSPIVRDIRAGRVGGVIIFDYDVALQSPVRNVQSPEQLRRLLSDLQAVSEDKLLIAVDQEGGKVGRLKEKFGFPPTVSQAWLGRQNDPELTFDYASRTASTLEDMGFNVNLSPVVDVNVNPDNPVIGRLERSFSSDPEIVALHSGQVISAHREKHILTALKHFPGHGSSTTDSHHGFTDVTDTWTRKELEPYTLLFDSPGVDMVMTAHVFNANLDSEWPATLSSPVLHDLLRVQMGYDGVIISDDMQMGAIRDYYGLETALERTINAGTDIIIFGNNLVYDPDVAVKARDIILELVRRERIPESRITESYDRIMKLKSGYSP
ncbi:MAG: glycoside hydrolase family 3 N-terminal domain-containing protein [Desulfonatronovibrio sp.]